MIKSQQPKDVTDEHKRSQPKDSDLTASAGVVLVVCFVESWVTSQLSKKADDKDKD